MGSSQSSDQNGLVESGDTVILRHPRLRYVKTVRTAVGLITVLLVFMAALDSILSLSYAPIGIYLFVIGTPMFLLEFGFIIRLLCGTNGILCRSFSLVLNFDKKKRAILYVLFAIPMFLPNFRNNYSIVAGVVVLVTAVLYFVKGWEFKKVRTFYSEGSVQQAREVLPEEPMQTNP